MVDPLIGSGVVPRGLHVDNYAAWRGEHQGGLMIWSLIVTALFAQELTDGSASQAALVIGLIGNGGLGGVMFFLYLSERKERQSAQKRIDENNKTYNALLERVLPALTDASTTLERVQESQAAMHKADTDGLQRQLDGLVNELRKGRGDR